MEELTSDLQRKNTFHEIKNQVSVCNLYIEVIKKTLAKENFHNDTVDRALKTISFSIKAIENSMQELKANINPIKLNPINLSAFIEDVFFACSGYLNGKNITFINNIDVNKKILADKDKMYTVFLNICKNAIEAIKESGFIKIYNDNSAIYIVNNGEQISEKLQKAIFDEGVTTKSEGSGLGLMLVKKLLNAQNFDIELVSSNENITVFKIIM